MIGGRLPHITCLTATRGRPGLLERSIRCYAAQTYPRKSLVVLSQAGDAGDAAAADHVRSLGRDDILFLTARPDLSLGEMRNTTVELATGDIVCQWDDDDLYHPDRLATQYDALRCDSRRVASVYCDFLKYYQTTGELYWCDWSGEPIPAHRYLCGSVMFYRRSFGEFRCFYPQSGAQSDVEEDLNVLQKLMSKGDIGPVFAGHQYVYVYHGGNVYGLDHHNLTLDTSWGKKVLSADQLCERRASIESTLRHCGVGGPVSVRSKEAEAFTFGE